MIVVMEADAPETAVEAVISYLVEADFDVHRSSGQQRTILGVVGDVSDDDLAVVRDLDAVAEVVRVSEPYRLASRRFRQRSTVVEGEFGTLGGERPWIALEPVGLPSTTEGPPSLPYEIASGRPFDAAITRERLAPDSIGALACLTLHHSPASPKWPVLFVTREPSWGADQWIGAAERELARKSKVVLLESGGESPHGPRSLEIAAIARARARTHLPIVVDVPTIAQQGRYCAAVASAAIAAGADGAILRVWVGKENGQPRLPATLAWEDAVDLAERLRQIGAIVRQ